jgi:hypothetical protein
MNVLPGGKARADVEKLPDPRLGGKKSHDPPQECPCGASGLRRPWEGIVRCLGRDPVGLEVVFAELNAMTWDNSSQVTAFCNLRRV